MTIERMEMVWIEAKSAYTADELAQLSGLPTTVLEDLVACGALPASHEASRTTACFETESVVLARAASRLRQHFELDDSGLAVAISLLRRVRVLEMRLAAVRGSVD